MNQMRRLIAVVHEYHWLVRNSSGFPEAVNRTDNPITPCSWRLTILESSLSGPYTHLPWKSPLNQAFDSEGNRRLFAVASRDHPQIFTQVFALVGAGTAFTEFETGKNRDTREAEPDAILLLDCENHLIHWMEPGDVEVDPLKSSTTGFGDLTPNYPEGFLVGFVDGSVWLIRKDVPHEVIAPFFTLEGAAAHDRDVDSAPYVIDRTSPLPKLDGRYVLPEVK